MDYCRPSEENCPGMSLPLDGAFAMPPGFRFHPTDEELVGYYLHKKLACKKINLDHVIKEIDLYKLEPWDLQEKCRIGSVEQNDWYFFSHTDKKYPTGTRTNRATSAGFWKATGRDKAVFTKCRLIGQRKTLVFYTGRAPNGQKTDWIMHEYRLEDEAWKITPSHLQADDSWVVCRVFKKRSLQQQPNDRHSSRHHEAHSSLTPDLHSYYQQSFACKHEFDLGSSEQHAHHLVFPKLPQLESPEICSDPPFQLELDRDQLNTLMQPISFETSMPTTSARFHHHDQHFSVFDDDEVTEWSLVDRLLAGQLNQQFNQKLMENTKSAAVDSSVGDLDNLVRLRKGQQHTDYSSACNGDLWSFANRNHST